MKYLFIAEKPSEMRAVKDAYVKNKATVDNALGGEIDFIALAGHIFRNAEPKEYKEWNVKWKTLYENRLPMIPKDWKIEKIRQSSDIVKKLFETIKCNRYDAIIVGTDADVEGYGIYYLCAKALKLEKYKTLRFYATSLAEKDIVKSLLSMTDFYADEKHRNAVNAYIFRSHWDWLIGMNLSVAYTVNAGSLMKIGSVKSPTLKLIYDNCKAIDEFVPHTAYNVVLTYDNKVQGKHTDDDKNEYKFDEKADAEAFMKTLGDTATVLSVNKKKQKTKAPKLYALSDLQVDASSKLGLSPDETLRIAQSLYEDKKILSYPRTSGNYVTREKATEFPALLKSLSGIPELKPIAACVNKDAIERVTNDTAVVNDKEAAKASHDALLPTGEKIDWEVLSEKEKAVFLLVAKRFLAHFMDEYMEEKTDMICENAGHHFISTGVKVMCHGWKALYEKEPKNKPIPVLANGTKLKVEKAEAEERTTQPPKRLTTGSLISVMKNIGKDLEDPKLKKVMKDGEGIGTEATRAGIIKSLSESINGGEGYIEIRKNAIYITETGKAYIENLYKGMENKDVIANPYAVSYWSYKNKQIELGNENGDEVMAEFIEYLKRVIAKVKERAVYKPPVRKDAEKIFVYECPVCGGDLVYHNNAVYCLGKCGFKPDSVLGKTLNPEQVVSLLNGDPVSLKGLVSKAGKKYSAKVIMTGIREYQAYGKTFYYPEIEFLER